LPSFGRLCAGAAAMVASQRRSCSAVSSATTQLPRPGRM
jgi:hypothetical protein